MEHTYTVSCGSVLLRPLAEGDIETLRKWRNDKSNTVYLRQLPYITPEMQKKWFADYLADESEICFAVCETERMNRLAGSISLYNIEGQKTALLGRLLIGDKEARGKGIGTWAVTGAVRFAFETLGLGELRLYVYKENTAAVKVYRRAGFEAVDEKVQDGRTEYTMRITAEEYRKRSAAE